MKKAKKLLSLLLCFVLLASMATAVLARYSYTDAVYSNLAISGSKATVTGYVKMTPDANEIEMTTRLLLDGSEIKSWSTPTSSTSTSSTIRKTVTLTDRGIYQVETEYTIYGPDGEDYDFTYSSEVEY